MQEFSGQKTLNEVLQNKFNQTNHSFLSYQRRNTKALWVLHMQYNQKENEAETLRHNVRNILQKNLNLKIKSNVPKDKRRLLKELQKNDKLRVNEFDKGC